MVTFTQLFNAINDLNAKLAKLDNPCSPSDKLVKAETKKSGLSLDDLKALCLELEELSDRDTVKGILGEYGYKSPGHVDEDAKSDIEDICRDIKIKISELDEKTESNEEEEMGAINIDEVKELYQKYQKENGVKSAKKLLEKYGLVSIKSVHKLDAEDIKAIFEEMNEE